MISQSTIDRVRDLPIYEIVSRYIELKKAGSSYTACSPFTNEKTPSFFVVPSKDIFKCFSTGKGGDGIRFVMELRNLSFPDAIVDICNTIGERFEYDSAERTKEEQENREQLFMINLAASKRYARELSNHIHDENHPIHKELIAKRKFTIDTLYQWQIGYAPGEAGKGFRPENWKFLTSALYEKALIEPAITLGLVTQKDKVTYDTFRNRIIFPVQNHNGRIVGFGGRSLQTDEYNPKYLNSNASELFDKRTVLFGLNFATQKIRDKKWAGLVEGYTDVISFHQNGYENVVGTCGTALTPEQSTLLKRFTNKVILFPDPDKAGEESASRSIDLLTRNGFEVAVVPMPKNEGMKVDPDELVRTFSEGNSCGDCTSLEDYISRHQQDAIKWKAEKLLASIDNPIIKNDRVEEIARTLALIPKVVARETYAKQIGKDYDIGWTTLKKLIDDSIASARTIEQKKEVRKNKVSELNGDARKWPFFTESIATTKNGEEIFKGVEIDLEKFTALLASFGFTRYETDSIATSSDDSFAFVKIDGNVIRNFSRQQIIDYVVDFIKKEYDFDRFRFVDSNILLNKFYKGMKTLFSKDLFARVKTEHPILINRDTADKTFIYYKNGFVTVTKDSIDFQSYEEMNGSVWEKQMLDRDFKLMDLDNHKDGDPYPHGVFADFCYRIADINFVSQDDISEEEREKINRRFESLCSILGYLMHDFYDYKLKAVLLTDSTLSEASEGRTGKTLLAKMLSYVRSYTEINGKDFDSGNKNKYEDVTLGTQVVHLNDVKTRGKNRFDFEDVFNDVTEGMIVNAKYMTPFRQFSKMIISTNKTLNITGASQRDRIIEFEMSAFFGESNSPHEYYGQWFGRDWDSNEWAKFDNFMAVCARVFHAKGLIAPATINLEARKLLNHTCQEFLDFMSDVREHIEKSQRPFDGYICHGGYQGTKEFAEFQFDKRQLHEHFVKCNPDFKHLSAHGFTKWLRLYSELNMKVKRPKDFRSGGIGYFQFKHD